jgi:hypothetical protein
VIASLEHARTMRRAGLEARCRIFLARLEVLTGRFDGALDALKPLSADREPALGPELRAQLHYWRSQALLGRLDRAASSAEALNARQLLDGLNDLLPNENVLVVRTRPDLRLITGQ